MENLNIYYVKEHDQTVLSTAMILDSFQALLTYWLKLFLVVWPCQIQLFITVL